MTSGRTEVWLILLLLVSAGAFGQTPATGLNSDVSRRTSALDPSRSDLTKSVANSRLPASTLAMVADSQSLSSPPADRLPLLKKSRGKAFFLSLLIPGMGERYTGRRGRAQFFLTSEILCWMGYAGFVTFSEWRKEDYHGYAADHAGAKTAGKSDDYFVNVGNYNNIDEYNAAKLRQRDLPDYYKDYERYYWKWQTAAERKKYDHLRLSAEQAKNRALFMIGSVVANHLISAFDAMWTAHSYNKSQKAGKDVNLNWGMSPDRVMLYASVSF